MNDPTMIDRIDRPVILATGVRGFIPGPGDVTGVRRKDTRQRRDVATAVIHRRLDLAAEVLGGRVCVMTANTKLGPDPVARKYAAERGWPVLDRSSDQFAACTEKCEGGHRTQRATRQGTCVDAIPRRDEAMINEIATAFLPYVVLLFTGETPRYSGPFLEAAASSHITVIQVGAPSAARLTVPVTRPGPVSSVGGAR